MRLEPPCEVTRDKLTFDVAEIEPLLQTPSLDLKPWPEAMMTLKDGRILYIREAKIEEAPVLLEYIKKILDVDYDFYDIVGARIYAEILGWYRKRIKDPFVLIGLIDGQLAGFGNGRMFSEDIAISFHTMAFIRGVRIGWAMYYAKTYYALEILKAKEWWSSYESYIGWRMAGIDMAQPCYAWPDHQHELGGSQIYYVTDSYWNKVIKKYVRTITRSELVFDIPEEVKMRNRVLKVPDKVEV